MDYNLLRNKIISHFKDLGDSYIPDGEWTDTQIANLKKKGYQGKFEYHDGKSLLVVKDKINFYHYKGPGYYSIKSNGMTVEIYESSYSEKNTAWGIDESYHRCYSFTKIKKDVEVFRKCAESFWKFNFRKVHDRRSKTFRCWFSS